MPTNNPTHASDNRFLAGLLAWEQLFGQKPLSWSELRDLGADFTPEEARDHLRSGLVDSQKNAAYQLLLEEHPELREILQPAVQRLLLDVTGKVVEVVESSQLGASRKQRAGAPHHFIAKLSPDVKPHPEEELAHIVKQAAAAPDQAAWFATRLPGKAWQPIRRGLQAGCVILYRRPEGTFDVLIADIVGRQDRRPDDDSVDDLYPEDPGFKGWWRLARPHRTRVTSLQQIPGSAYRSNRPAVESFNGMASFVYWSFPAPSAAREFLSASPPPLLH